MVRDLREAGGVRQQPKPDLGEEKEEEAPETVSKRRQQTGSRKWRKQTGNGTWHDRVL